MDGRLIIRPHPWRQVPITIMMMVLNAAIIWAWFISVRPDRTPGFATALVVIWGIYLLEAAWVKLIVTSEYVQMISSHRDPPISREQIYNIRALRLNTVFYDYDQQPILRTRADLSRSQLLALANGLRVDVWDHRTWHGLKELHRGVRLNQEPFPHRLPS